MNQASQGMLKTSNMSVIAAMVAMAIAVGSLGVYFSYLAIRGQLLAQAEQNWPTTDATIENHLVFSQRHRHAPTTWYVVWAYTYTVDSRTYQTHSDALPGGFSTKQYPTEDDAMLHAQSRPNGRAVTVYYDPADPSRSTLDRRNPDSSGMSVALTGAALIMMIAGSILHAAFGGYKKLTRSDWVATTE